MNILPMNYKLLILILLANNQELIPSENKMKPILIMAQNNRKIISKKNKYKYKS